MTINVSGWVWLNDREVCSAEHLVEVSGLSMEQLDDLIENGIIEPANKETRPQQFHLHHVVTANTARRLHDDFELDLHGVALALTLLRRINELQDELRAVRAELAYPVPR